MSLYQIGREIQIIEKELDEVRTILNVFAKHLGYNLNFWSDGNCPIVEKLEDFKDRIKFNREEQEDS